MGLKSASSQGTIDSSCLAITGDSITDNMAAVFSPLT
jgi:hypothetical protein